MKRLNPETGKPFVRGDARADGFLFCHYRYDRLKKNGLFGECWRAPTKIESRRQYVRDWRLINPQKSSESNRAWREVNPEQKRNTFRAWSKNNRAKLNAIGAKRHAAKLQRTPPWLTKEHLQQIESVYAESKRLTIETGILHHVDHIVPLQGDTVSGLHVPWNLRAIPAAENMSKHNKHL